MIIKPNKENLTTFVIAGGLLILISFLDILVNTFFQFNLTAFLPDKISFFVPLLFGVVGLYLIRIEFSGNKTLDKMTVIKYSTTLFKQ